MESSSEILDNPIDYNPKKTILPNLLLIIESLGCSLASLAILHYLYTSIFWL